VLADILIYTPLHPSQEHSRQFKKTTMSQEQESNVEI
jgi:hypothetical protein